jgi:hypothetical protein
LVDPPTAYAALVDGYFIVPGDAEASYLVHKLRGDASISGEPMPPPDYELISTEDLNTVIAWIDGGAPG